MDEFRKHYSAYSAVLCFTALWPYDQSVRGKIQRVTLPICFIAILTIQISTLRWVEKSLYNILMMLSTTCPMVLYLLRYVGFTLNRSIVKVTFGKFLNDYSATKDPVEVEIFARQIISAKRVFLAFLGLTMILLGYLVIVLIIPTILRSEMQLEYLNIFGFFYPEMNHETDVVSVFLVFINIMGLLSVATTESSIAVSSAYLCALLEIASYRIEVAIDNVVQSNSSEEVLQVRSVVELHIRVVTTLHEMMNEMLVPYLIAIVAVIISFAVNLFRLLLVVQNMDSFSNVFFSFNDVLLHFAIMYLNNLSGQRMIDTSMFIFQKICKSEWYCIPLRSQKILLFMLMNCVKEIHCNLAGLYELGFEGFSMMMSSSFSYFTVMCSTQ